MQEQVRLAFTYSLDHTYDDDSKRTLGDTLEAEEVEVPPEVHQLLSTLPAEAQRVVALKFRLCDSLDPGEHAEDDINRERLRQILAASLISIS